MEIRTGKEKGLKNRAAYFGVFTALALIFSYVETLIPIHFGIPGVKLGLANLAIVIILYKTDFKEALLLSVTRVILAGFIFGSLFSILYSMAGGVLSLIVMTVMKQRKSFSIIGVSIAGGVSHNIGQLVVAMLVVETYRVGYYLPHRGDGDRGSYRDRVQGSVKAGAEHPVCLICGFHRQTDTH